MKKIFASVFSILHLILTLVFLCLLFKLNVLPADIYLIITGVLAIFAAVSLCLTFGKKVRAAVFPISVIFICILSVGSYYIHITDKVLEESTGNSIDNIQSEDEYVSVIVMADAEIETISDLDGKTVGTDKSIEADKMSFALDWILKNYPVNFTENPYDRIDTLIDDLYSGEISAIIMDSSRYAICDDVRENFLSETREIAKLKIDYSALYALTPTSTPTNTPTESPDAPQGGVTERPFIVYISGIDTYGSIGTRSRTDTNILMAVDPVNKKILLVSTPRDTYVPLYNVSGDVKDKLTHSGLYGPECSMGTLATLYNTQIDYYIRVNFTSVIDIVDALDGIDVYSAYTFNSRNLRGYSYVEGTNHLDGKATLAFCRERYSFPDGDYQRGRNHIEVIKGVINRAISPSILINYPSLISALSGSFQTNMTSDELTSLIKMQLADGASWNFESMTLVNKGSTSTTCYSLSGPALYVGIVDETSRQEIEDALAAFMSP